MNQEKMVDPIRNETYSDEQGYDRVETVYVPLCFRGMARGTQRNYYKTRSACIYDED